MKEGEKVKQTGAKTRRWQKWTRVRRVQKNVLPLAMQKGSSRFEYKKAGAVLTLAFRHPSG